MTLVRRLYTKLDIYFIYVYERVHRQRKCETSLPGSTYARTRGKYEERTSL